MKATKPKTKIKGFTFIVIGHGPFSHTFDGSFLPRVRQGKEEWKVCEFVRCTHLLIMDTYYIKITVIRM